MIELQSARFDYYYLDPDEPVPGTEFGSTSTADVVGTILIRNGGDHRFKMRVYDSNHFTITLFNTDGSIFFSYETSWRPATSSSWAISGKG